METPSNEPDIVAASVDARAYNIGDVLPDGWVVGGVSPTTGEAIAIEPLEGALKGYQTWYRGEDHAKALREQGHAGARQPDKNELSALYNNVVREGRNQNAGFETSIFIEPYGRYWMSDPGEANQDVSSFLYFDLTDERGCDFKTTAAAYVRCIRDEPGLVLR